MPNLRWTNPMTANQLGANPLAGWQYEFIPQAWVNGAAVKLLQRATTINIRQTVYATSQTMVQRSPIQGGGVAGVTPSELNTAPDVFVAQPGDRLIIANDETGGVVGTVDGIIMVEPL